MATAEEIEGQIAHARQTLAEKTQTAVELCNQIDQANTRQRLRRELDEVWDLICRTELANSERKSQIIDINRDKDGAHMPATGELDRVSASDAAQKVGEIMRCSKAVKTMDFVWKIEGMSWLHHALRSTGGDSDFACSSDFKLGHDSFSLRYWPDWPDEPTRHSERPGSLYLVHDHRPVGISFRYRMFVKDISGEFRQWGGIGDVCNQGKTWMEQEYGPDVNNPTGVFGLTHSELLESRWVDGDSMTVRVELQLRERKEVYDDDQPITKPMITVPEPSLVPNLLKLLDTGNFSDVTFFVEEESIKAHASILSARSEVFEKLLAANMKESLSREVVISDCSSVAFRAMLRFLYSDDFSTVQDFLSVQKPDSGAGSSSSSIPADAGGVGAGTADEQVPLLQSILSVSHKYQVCRLRSWCEKMLCDHISVEKVCSILCQAHLYEAKQLEEACLNFIKDNASKVMVSAGFGQLGKDWPQILLKVSLSLSGISEAQASAAIQAQQGVGYKRKRDDSD
eukprot:gb/GFBE01065596.1/.p1 GENE.gb/GFBE01065596.1/~~gb/GFBE01065596.1/.p1  ORF type:complete len:512 (+),score=106.56 gb/GFBE01065596.1/:1-1536(+)